MNINNNRILLYILYTYNKLIYFINKIKSIKYFLYAIAKIAIFINVIFYLNLRFDHKFDFRKLNFKKRFIDFQIIIYNYN